MYDVHSLKGNNVQDLIYLGVVKLSRQDLLCFKEDAFKTHIFLELIESCNPVQYVQAAYPAHQFSRGGGPACGGWHSLCLST